MQNWTLLSLPKKLLRPYKRATIRVVNRILPQKKQLLFVFGGRTQHWPGMGSRLYANEPAFRESIQKCDKIFRELSGISILNNFEGKAPADLFDDEAQVICVIAAIQIALNDLWQSKGIIPNAIMGISLGEATGLYAAGGISLEDTLKLVIDSTLIHQLEKRSFIPIYLQCSMQEAQTLSKKSPVFLAPIYEAGEQGVLLLCPVESKEAVDEFFTEQNLQWTIPHNDTTWPYHTKILNGHRDALTRYSRNVEVMPLQRDYYSCLTGRRMPAGTLIENSFWLESKCKPVLLHSALCAVRENPGMEVIVDVGAPTLAKGQVIRSMGNQKIEVLSCFHKGKDEIQLMQSAHRKLMSHRYHPANVPLTEQEFLHQYLNHFNLYNPVVQQDLCAQFRFLKRYGNVHYLPSHKLWLVLDFDHIEYALKNPNIFSSSIHKGFDEVLVGSDPPDHTVMRSLLQPLFSPQVFTELGAFTNTYANALLDELLQQQEFNFVERFSLPLAQAVVARLLGLSEEDEKALRNSMKEHVYSMRHLVALHDFFKNHLQTAGRGESNKATTLVLSFVERGHINFEAAVKLLRLLWVAGMTTTSMLLSTAVYRMMRDPLLVRQLKDDDQLLNRFIEECLRLETPESVLRRITTTDVRVGNKEIPAGSEVMLALCAANRDPKYFDNPDEIVLDRPAKKHLAFGGGYHYCLGVGIARMEVKYALKAILEKIDCLQLKEDRPVDYFLSSHFRGLSELNICIDRSK